MKIIVIEVLPEARGVLSYRPIRASGGKQLDTSIGGPGTLLLSISGKLLKLTDSIKKNTTDKVVS
jgi:hypothetical protein